MAQLLHFVRSRLAALADPAKAGPMAAYMKTSIPFYGVPKPQRVPIQREAIKRFPPANRSAYAKAVLDLWSGSHREEKYIAIAYARAFPGHIVPASLPMYRRMIIDGAWWDFVDDISVHLVGTVTMADHGSAKRMDAWVEDSCMWIRRAALLNHLKHKARTDKAQLFAHCLCRAHEREFFIRKAIGWTLRGYAGTSPAAGRSVKAFLKAHPSTFSGLTVREASKHLNG